MRGRLIEGSGPKHKRLMAWRAHIRECLPPVVFDGPVAVELSFVFRRPKSAAKREFMSVRPDVDKLCRAVLDALTLKDGVGCLVEDSRVVRLKAEKVYGDVEGCWIRVVAL